MCIERSKLVIDDPVRGYCGVNYNRLFQPKPEDYQTQFARAEQNGGIDPTTGTKIIYSTPEIAPQSRQSIKKAA